ncbi:hypothetical protein GCM10010191_90170 [Actinomadura vinacea]|uniref:Uncharacterized protein n=1 Tax=Actinomadura vinacea TaxID=115336 RepID=A0ABN3KDQ6_9ACTN
MCELITPASDGAGEEQTADVVAPEEARQIRTLIANHGRDVEDIFKKYLKVHQVIEVIELGIIELAPFARALKAGATYEEVIDAWNRRMSLLYYADYRAAGATHQEALEAKGMPYYDHLREAGASHTEALYVHEKAKDADAYHLAVEGYIKARKAGATHAEIVDALDKGIDFPLYAKARVAKIKHHVALFNHAEGFLQQLISGMHVHNRI